MSANNTLKTRIESLEKLVAVHQKRLARGNTLTAIIGTLIVGFIIVYFSIGLSAFSNILETNTLLDTVETQIEENVPAARKSLQEQIITSAPGWAEKATASLIEYIPTGREKLEDYLMAQLDEQIEKGAVLTADRLRSFVKANKGALKDGFDRIAESPDEAGQFVATLTPLLEKEMGADMKTHADDTLYLLYDLNSKLDDLKVGERLDKTQALEREILMICRRLQVQEADPKEKDDAADVDADIK